MIALYIALSAGVIFHILHIHTVRTLYLVLYVYPFPLFTIWYCWHLLNHLPFYHLLLYFQCIEQGKSEMDGAFPYSGVPASHWTSFQKHNDSMQVRCTVSNRETVSASPPALGAVLVSLYHGISVCLFVPEEKQLQSPVAGFDR